MERLQLADNIHTSSKSNTFDNKRGTDMAKLLLADNIYTSSKSKKFDDKWVRYLVRLFLADNIIFPELQGLFQLCSVWDKHDYYNYSRHRMEMDIQHIIINGAKSRQHCSQFRCIDR